MATFKVLVGGCIKQQPDVLRYYLKSLAALKPPPDAELHFGFVNDDSEAQAAMLQTAQPVVILQAEERPKDALYGVGPETHHWTVSTFEHLARQKQRLCDWAVAAGYTHVFLVDSDLLLEPTTLQSLWETKGDIANAVFWTAWQNGGPPQPQCWLSHPYGMDGYGMEEAEFIRRLSQRDVLRVAGGGAAVLIATAALKKGVRYHPRLPLPEGSMWQGEDRTFAVLAQRFHERQLADGWPDVFHAYHPEMRQPAVLEEAWAVLSAPRQQRAKYGDQISIVIDPLEDVPLANAVAEHPEVRCFRGRLGSLPLAPEIEAALLCMGPGDSTLINVSFPPWHELPAYRGQQKVVRVKLVDIKAYSYAPVLADVAFAGVQA